MNEGEDDIQEIRRYQVYLAKRILLQSKRALSVEQSQEDHNAKE